jgi:hypothetical protein
MTAPPVTSFFTVNETDRVILKWTTENEEADQWFEILRSVDGKNFTSLGMEAGKGISIGNNTYALTDMEPFAGVAYYRLVQRSRLGDVRFTDTKLVSRAIVPVTFYTVYPNPVQGILNIKLTAANNSALVAEVFDMNGRRMMARNFATAMGEQNLSIDMSRFNNGAYILKITTDGKTSSQLVHKF